MIVSVDEVLDDEARRQPFAAARCAAKASMLAGESARASKMPARQPMAYSPRGGPPAISGLVLCVPTISSTSRDQAIFVDRATGASLPPYAVMPEDDRLW